MNDKNGFGVYRIVAPSGSMYVGMTTISFSGRWLSHQKDLRKAQHKCAGLQRAFNKYGLENLSFEILETMSMTSNKSDILLLERDWWDKFKSQGKNLYNGRPTGTGSVIHTEETKSKISASLIRSTTMIWSKCAVCAVQFESLNRKHRVYCSKSCSRSDPNKKRGIASKVSKDQLLSLIAQGLSKPEMALLLGYSIQSVCDLHRIWGIKTPKNKKN